MEATLAADLITAFFSKFFAALALKISDNGLKTRLNKKTPFPSFFANGESLYAVRESVNKSAASATSLDYVKFEAVIESAASAASLREGRASGRLDHGLFVSNFARPKKYQKNEQAGRVSIA